MTQFGPSTYTVSGTTGRYDGYPLSGAITSTFGAWEPFRQRMGLGRHRGLDIGAAEGSRIFAPAPGTVKVSAYDPRTNGYYLVLDHGGGVESAYLHMMGWPNTDGQLLGPGFGANGTVTVERGQHIGNVGATGAATGPHLHWALKVDGAYVDPLTLVAEDVDALTLTARQMQWVAADYASPAALPDVAVRLGEGERLDDEWVRFALDVRRPERIPR